MIDESQRKAARVAALAYLVSVVAVVFAEFVIRAHPMVAGTAAETARNFVAHDRLFRIGIACDLIYCAGVVVLLTALYVILKPVNQNLALLQALCRLIYAFTWILITLHVFSVLRLYRDAGYLRVFDLERLQALARLYLGPRFEEYYVGLLFYAVGATVGSYLWLQSSYIPRALAGFGVISSAWCAACTFVFIIFPNFDKVVNLWWFDSPMAIFEMATSFWLLFKGLTPSGIAEAPR
jgi:hypothetical protein